MMTFTTSDLLQTYYIIHFTIAGYMIWMIYADEFFTDAEFFRFFIFCECTCALALAYLGIFAFPPFQSALLGYLTARIGQISLVRVLKRR